jgi:hypothetical protein
MGFAVEGLHHGVDLAPGVLESDFGGRVWQSGQERLTVHGPHRATAGVCWGLGTVSAHGVSGEFARPWGRKPGSGSPWRISNPVYRGPDPYRNARAYGVGLCTRRLNIRVPRGGLGA